MEFSLNLFSVQKQYEEAKDEAAKASQETERLLQVVQMTQEEQNAKEKTIMDLQQYVDENRYISFFFSNSECVLLKLQLIHFLTF